MQRSCGLFPAPLPQNSSDMPRVEKLFQFMGMFFAKCIQDNRIVDLPLSRPLLKMLCMGDVADHISHNYRDLLIWHDSESGSVKSPADDDLTPTMETSNKDPVLDLPKIKPSLSMPTLIGGPWYAGLLTQDDFELVDPHRARFLDKLRSLSARKQDILTNLSFDEKQKMERLEKLTLDNPPVKLEDLRLTS